MNNPAGPNPADQPAGARTGVIRTLLNGAIFIAACALGCWVIGKVRSFPTVPGLYPKWAYVQENLGKFDTIFIGSSRFYHQIIPVQFDAALAQAQMPARSFNFGYDGMWPPESFYMLRRILALHPPRLKWVFIDLMDINSKLDDRNNSTLRMAYWHDWKHTRMAVDDIMASRWKPQQKYEAISQHVKLCVRYLANMGCGSDLLQDRMSPPKKKATLTWSGREGWEVGPARSLEGEVREKYESDVRRLASSLPPAPVGPIFSEALAGLIADVRRAGAEPIFLIAPTINPRENFTEVPGNAPVFGFNNPATYPELFETKYHYDEWHLNELGAVIFTQRIAERFIEWRKGEK